MTHRRGIPALVLAGVAWATALWLGAVGLPHAHDGAAGSHPVESCKVSRAHGGVAATPVAAPITLAVPWPLIGHVVLPPAAEPAAFRRSPFSTRAPPRSS